MVYIYIYILHPVVILNPTKGKSKQKQIISFYDFEFFFPCLISLFCNHRLCSAPIWHDVSALTFVLIGHLKNVRQLSFLSAYINFGW